VLDVITMGMRIIIIWLEVEGWKVEAECRWEGREGSAPRAASADQSKEVTE
jgi:hypothetical protein